MRRSQNYPYEAPVGGVNKSTPPELMNDLESPHAQNVDHDEGEIKKRHGYAMLGTATATTTSTAGFTDRRAVANGLDTAVMGMYQYRLFDGTEYLLAASQTKVYKYDATNEEWDSLHTVISGTSTSTYATFNGTNTDYFYIDSVYDLTNTDPWVAITNGDDSDAISVWKGGNDTLEQLYTGTAGPATLRAKYLLQFKNHLLLFNTTEGGNPINNRIRWSDTADPADFENGNASFLDLHGSDPITGAIRFKNDYCVVGRRRSLYMGYATGDANIFQFDYKSNNGAVNGRTMVDVGNYVIYLGDNDVYAFDGINSVPIGENIREDIIGDIDFDYEYRLFAVKKQDDKQYLLFYPHRGGGGIVRYAWVYDYGKGRWIGRNFYADDMNVAAEFTGQRVLTIGDLSGTIGDQTGTIGGWASTSNIQAEVFGDTGGDVYKLDNVSSQDYDTDVDAYFETRDFHFSKEDINFRVIRIDVFWSGESITLSYSEDGGGSWTSIGTSTTDGRSTFWSRLHTDKIRFKFSNNNSTGFFKFRKANFHWQPAGDRL